MGFSQIYILGCDYTHQPSRIKHWYEKGKGQIEIHHEYSKQFLDIAQEYVDITTVTLDGKSEVLPYVSYRDFTGSNPEFKENTDIATLEDLRLLDTYPDYNIF